MPRPRPVRAVPVRPGTFETAGPTGPRHPRRPDRRVPRRDRVATRRSPTSRRVAGGAGASRRGPRCRSGCPRPRRPACSPTTASAAEAAGLQLAAARRHGGRHLGLAAGDSRRLGAGVTRTPGLAAAREPELLDRLARPRGPARRGRRLIQTADQVASKPDQAAAPTARTWPVLRRLDRCSWPIPISPDTLLSGSAALLVLAIVLFAECGLLIGFFLPGDTLLFAAGIAIATGAITHVAGRVPDRRADRGDRRQPGRLLDRLPRRAGRVRPAELAAVPARVRHRARTRSSSGSGRWTIILGRFVPIVRTVATVMAGVGRMRFSLYALYSIDRRHPLDRRRPAARPPARQDQVRPRPQGLDRRRWSLVVVVLALVPAAVHYWQGRRQARRRRRRADRPRAVPTRRDR